MLRRELSARSHHLARAQKLLHDVSPGANPVVIFGRDEQGRHGNFHPDSYTQICANPAWARRLTKVHTASRRSRARKDWQWMELDSANSSDALLMNIFCHPGVFSEGNLNPRVANLLNVEPAAQPCFGINPGVPSQSGHLDRTEIDLHLGNLFVEAKLTETSFQNARPRLIERYRDLETVFDISRACPGRLAGSFRAISSSATYSRPSLATQVSASCLTLAAETSSKSGTQSSPQSTIPALHGD